MSTILTTISLVDSNLTHAKAVIERRAEMASQCECLAAWIDGRECVCDKSVAVPLLTDNLKEAHRLVGEIADCEARIARVEKMGKDDISCRVASDKFRYSQHGQHYEADDEGNPLPTTRINVPKPLLIAALKDERAGLITALQATGIVSVARDNIRVLPK